jgi:aspartyl-tRNA(Asn)/glutamyl-tRNA(Gln) amidotransferase subunit A
MLGTYVLSAGYYDAYYKKAQRVRRLVLSDFLDAFGKVDVILAPTTPTTAFKIGEKIDDPLAMYLSDVYTTPANLAGIPAVAVPAGNDSKGLPIGVQIMGPHFSEELILQVGCEIERLHGGV